MSLKDTSKFIALVLRHKPWVAGITLDGEGWADVGELIAGVGKTHPITREILDEIVYTDEKGRYSFDESGTRIRANQGHSIPVDVGLKEATPQGPLYHGTAEKYAASIEAKGLDRRSRLYVHLSPDPDTAVSVGKRHGRPVVYEIDTEAMLSDGLVFYLSENGVWLTESVPPKYLKRLGG